MTDADVVVVSEQQDDDANVKTESFGFLLVMMVNLVACFSVFLAFWNVFRPRKVHWPRYLLMWAFAQALFQFAVYTRWALLLAEERSRVACVLLWMLDRSTAVSSTWALVALWVTTSWPEGRSPCKGVAVGLLLSGIVLFSHELAISEKTSQRGSCASVLKRPAVFAPYLDAIHFIFFMVVNVSAPLVVGVAIVRVCWLKVKLELSEDLRIVTSFALTFLVLSILSAFDGIMTAFFVKVKALDKAVHFCVIVHPFFILCSLLTSATFRKALVKRSGPRKEEEEEEDDEFESSTDSKDTTIQI